MTAYLTSRRVTGGRSRRGCAPATLSCYEQKSTAIKRRLGGDTDVNTLTLDVLEAYIAGRREDGVADATIHKELGVLFAALKRGRRTGAMRVELDLIRPEFSCSSEPGERYLTRPEFDALLVELHPRRAEVVRFCVYSGARDGEWQRMHAQHVRLRHGMLELPGTKSKHARRLIPIAVETHPELLILACELLAQRDGGGPLLQRWHNRRRDLAAACKRAGIARVTFNDLRRTFATWLRQAGVAPDRIARLLGDADTRMVERTYAKLEPRDLAGDVARAFALQTSARPELPS